MFILVTVNERNNLRHKPTTEGVAEDEFSLRSTTRYNSTSRR